MQELLKALSKAKANFQPIRKDKQNPFTKGRYASLDAVLNAVQHTLTANGLHIVHVPLRDRLTTRLWHESGEFLECEDYPLSNTFNPQQRGSEITYARRYTVCALLSVVADEDDDGESTKKSAPAKTSKPTTKADWPARARELINLYCKDLGMNWDFVSGELDREGLPVNATGYVSDDLYTRLELFIEGLYVANR